MNQQELRRLQAALRVTVSSAAVALACSTPAQAAPVTYRAQVFTDVKLAGVAYHNASLELTFVGDTANIVEAAVPGIPADTSITWITTGAASFTVSARGKTFSGTFPAGEIFVSLDGSNGGLGFGANFGGGHYEPGYPLVFDDYTAGNFAYAETQTPGVVALAQSAELSGKAWSCMGFPMPYGSPPPAPGTPTTCTPPDQYPLTTSIGDLVVYQPYLRTNLEGNLVTMLPDGNGQYAYWGNYEGSLNRGTFSIAPK